MSAELARQQQAILAALQAPAHAAAFAQLSAAGAVHERGAWQRGLLAYRTNADALAHRALQAAYPVVSQLVGDEAFDALARALWRDDPPRRGDIAQWGGAFAQAIAADPRLAAEAYLPDVARAEWALHAAATAADAVADPATLALLTDHDPAQLQVELAPGTACVASRHPVASIVLAHLEGTPTFGEAGRRLRDGVAETALVWREGLKPRVRAALAGETPFVRALQEGRTLADSLEAAPGLDIAAWLALAVQTGLLVRVRLA